MPQKIKKLSRSIIPLAPRPRFQTRPADYVFITQYYKNGGAERVINNYISALRELHKGLKITIIATDFDDHATWEQGVPRGVQFINLSPYSEHLARYLRVQLLASVLKSIQPTTLHIVNSKVGLGYLRRSKLRTQNYVSLFNSDFDSSGRSRTYYKELKPAAKFIERIFTDNATVIEEATASTGLPRSLFRVHYQPIKAQVKTPHKLPKTGKIRLLWASRLTQQKRPDILRKLIQVLDPNTFSTSVYGATEPPYDSHYFDGLTSVKYHKTYTSFEALPTEDFDIFLYTSQADGMPNVLLEAAAAGLPIIAPDVGGIAEFIADKTGFLIPDFTDVKAYATVLEAIARDRPDLTQKIQSAQHLLRTRHSEQAFLATVKKDIKI